MIYNININNKNDIIFAIIYNPLNPGSGVLSRFVSFIYDISRYFKFQ